jgi:hypothetical protein
VHRWLAKLLSERLVDTITTTGHSLGGALATLCAHDVAEALGDWGGFKAKWGKIFKSETGQDVVWATAEAPKVTAITWAAPRSGNFSYARRMTKDLGVKVLRICNKRDIVPTVPGARGAGQGAGPMGDGGSGAGFPPTLHPRLAPWPSYP